MTALPKRSIAAGRDRGAIKGTEAVRASKVKITLVAPPWDKEDQPSDGSRKAGAVRAEPDALRG